MQKIKNVEKTVFEILKKCPYSRGDDYLLYYYVIGVYFERNPKLGNINRVSFASIMCDHYALGLPSYETVTRARRKLQAKHPELISKPDACRRRKAEKVFREYANDVSL